MFLYCKVSTLTSSTLRSLGIGTITNLITNDFSSFDERLTLVFYIPLFVVGMVGIFAIFSSIIGIIGIIPILIILSALPVTHCLSKLNSGITERLTQLRDKRIQISA